MTLIGTLNKWSGEVRAALKPPALSVLTIFITNRCNAKCGTCFYWSELNTPRDALSLEEYGRIAEATPPVPHILFSGGEPTMDSRLPEVAKLFVRSPRQTVTMPTNGIVKKQVMKTAEGLVAAFPENRIVIGVSFDGFAETHDRVRGVKDNFKKSMETLAALCELRDRTPNMRVTTLTCLLKQNVGEVPDLLRHFDAETGVDFVTVEPLRGQRKDLELQGPTLVELKGVQSLASEINMRRLMERHPAEATLMLSHLDELYRTQQRFYETGKLGTVCRAGEVTAVLEVNGGVRCCELLDVVGNVREHGFSIPSVLQALAAEKQRRETILAGKCECTHCVNIGHSLNYDRKAEFHRLFRQKYLAWRLFHNPM